VSGGGAALVVGGEVAPVGLGIGFQVPEHHNDERKLMG
jgi:hypothetical protein